MKLHPGSQHRSALAATDHHSSLSRRRSQAGPSTSNRNGHVADMHTSRNAGALILILLLGAMLRPATAQSLLPDAPGELTADQQSGTSLSGTVTDPHGAYVANATVTLEDKATTTRRTLITDPTGSFTFTA